MRKVTLGLANSLDNYIARKDGGSDWLHWNKEIAEISAKFMKTVDAILIDLKFLKCQPLKNGGLVV